MGTPEQAIADDADQQRLFEQLNSYLEALQIGDAERCRLLLQQHPELADFGSCFASLHRLGPGNEPSAASAEAADSPPPAVVPGQPFGRYELLGELGRGGMGVVYQARHLDLERVVALKMIRSSQLATPQEVRRFQQEALAVARLRHPHIVAIHDVGEVHGQQYFTMDFVAGPDLATLLSRNGPLEPQQAASWLLALARAVEYLHTQQILHRDLKPSNVLLDEQLQPHLVDFGLAKVLQADATTTQSGSVVGTAAYMSPEQARGAGNEVTALSDVYSLGAILYEMLTGRPPVSASSYVDAILQVLEGEPPAPRSIQPNIPRDLERICLRALAKSPAQRYPSAAALADDLDRFLRHEPVEAGQPDMVTKLRTWARRAPALALHLAAIVVVLGIVMGRYALFGGEGLYHFQVLLLFATWAGVSVLLQWAMNRSPERSAARLVWSLVDVALLTWLLSDVVAPGDLLLAAYPLVIAASGLWFRVHVVWFTTLACVAASAVLLSLYGFGERPAQYNIIFLAVLIAVGGGISYQVHRLRILSRYFERRLP